MGDGLERLIHPAKFISDVIKAASEHLFYNTVNNMELKDDKFATSLILADLTVSKTPGTSYKIEIHFAVVNHLYLLFSFVNLIET